MMPPCASIHYSEGVLHHLQHYDHRRHMEQIQIFSCDYRDYQSLAENPDPSHLFHKKTNDDYDDSYLPYPLEQMDNRKGNCCHLYLPVFVDDCQHN